MLIIKRISIFSNECLRFDLLRIMKNIKKFCNDKKIIISIKLSEYLKLFLHVFKFVQNYQLKSNSKFINGDKKLFIYNAQHIKALFPKLAT